MIRVGIPTARSRDRSPEFPLLSPPSSVLRESGRRPVGCSPHPCTHAASLAKAAAEVRASGNNVDVRDGVGIATRAAARFADVLGLSGSRTLIRGGPSSLPYVRGAALVDGTCQVSLSRKQCRESRMSHNRLYDALGGGFKRRDETVTWKNIPPYLENTPESSARDSQHVSTQHSEVSSARSRPDQHSSKRETETKHGALTRNGRRRQARARAAPGSTGRWELLCFVVPAPFLPDRTSYRVLARQPILPTPPARVSCS